MAEQIIHERKIISIEKIETTKPGKHYYDIEVEDNHNFFANGVLSSNCHIAAAKSLVKISNYLPNTLYRLGLTGTPFRDDKEDMKMFGVCGDIIYTKQTEELINEGWLTPSECFFIKLKGDDKRGETYQESYTSNIVENEERNDKAVELVRDNPGKKILILTKLVAHGKAMAEKIPNSEFIYGGTKDEKRKEQFKKFQDGHIQVLVGSASIFSKGINIPDLDIIINLAGNKGEVQTIQSIGRVLRKSGDKETAYYFDFIDNGGYHYKASKARMKILKEFGHKIQTIN